MTFHINIQQGLTYRILLLHKWFSINKAVSVCGAGQLNLIYNNCCGFRGTSNWQSRSMRDEHSVTDCWVNLPVNKPDKAQRNAFYVRKFTCDHVTWEQPVKRAICFIFKLHGMLVLYEYHMLWQAQHILYGNACIGLFVLSWDRAL